MKRGLKWGGVAVAQTGEETVYRVFECKRKRGPPGSATWYVIIITVIIFFKKVLNSIYTVTSCVILLPLTNHELDAALHNSTCNHVWIGMHAHLRAGGIPQQHRNSHKTFYRTRPFFFQFRNAFEDYYLRYLFMGLSENSGAC